jgi:carbamoyltransferase
VILALTSVVTLGINDGHTAGAALVKDGQVAAAIQEERLVNIKNYSGVPHKSIAEVLEISKVHPQEVDVIAIVSMNRVYAPLAELPWKVRLFEQISPLVHSHAWSHFYVRLLHKRRRMDELRQALTANDLLGKELMFVEHHRAHAATAFYSRWWDEPTLVLTADGAGDGLSSTVSVGRGFDMERLASSTYYDSVGNSFYSEITSYLGMKRWEHEYKVMGLAPYGKPEYCLDLVQSLIRVHPSRPLEFQNTSRKCGTQVQKVLRKRLVGQRFDNVAAACQKHFEDLMVQWTRNAIAATGLHKIACAGGLFLNVKANKLVRELDEVEDILFYPACDDGGTPVGAAMEAYYRFCERDGRKPEHHPLGPVYYGTEFGDDEVVTAVKTRGLWERTEKIGEIDAHVGELVAKGKIIARFRGRTEWGPRALGNRSILADPRDIRMVKRINAAIKQRDFWMPFAPSILEERMGDYLVEPRPARYMIEAFETTSQSAELAAALHPQDGSARPQTVNSWNAGYRVTLQTFQEATGVGGVLNTSFNIHGYPIVGSPELALWTFENSQLDALALGDYLISK